MRTHDRKAAPLAVLFLSVTLLVAQFLFAALPAGANHRQAPPTAENFARLRECESGDDYGRLARNRRYSGAYQFSTTTWRSLGYPDVAHLHAPEVQDEAAQRLQAKAGWGQWPSCSRRLGLR